MSTFFLETNTSENMGNLNGSKNLNFNVTVSKNKTFFLL